ncbi:uncharacterized protein LOC133201581 [Saccostrea echinata]|uniref:uncharacterized protein LOC133201581 n=1 Tax=Saccostrea echinata TaxID=191078 RepID=UPI002A8054EA|nr:uncharacterized protein LOC133201581 [Saccostrea echinata]
MNLKIVGVSIVFFLLLPGHRGISIVFTPGKRLSGFVMEEISPIGKEMCVKECAKRATCASINFHRGRLECELSFNNGMTNTASLLSDEEYIYIERKEIPQVYFDRCNAPRACSPLESCIRTSTGPKCIQSDCPVHHPDANTTSVKVTATKVDTVLTYTCNSDPSITLTSTCRSNGTWSSSSSSCKTTACLAPMTTCWYKYNFTHDNEFNGCAGGPEYVKKTEFTSAPLVGVVLCTPTRYKLFLGENLTTTFFNIGDGSGSGQDHCELVGGSQTTAIIPGDYNKSPAVTGYFRSHEGQEFQFGKIGIAQSSYYFNSYLECGVSIPDPVP